MAMAPIKRCSLWLWGWCGTCAQDTGRSKKGFLGFGGGGGAAEPAPALQSPTGPDGVMTQGRPSSGGGAGISLGSLADPSDYIAAHFDKKVNEESARQSLPVDGWRWQKRFFIFSGEGSHEVVARAL